MTKTFADSACSASTLLLGPASFKLACRCGTGCIWHKPSITVFHARTTQVQQRTHPVSKVENGSAWQFRMCCRAQLMSWRLTCAFTTWSCAWQMSNLDMAQCGLYDSPTHRCAGGSPVFPQHRLQALAGCIARVEGEDPAVLAAGCTHAGMQHANVHTVLGSSSS
jgi:hypothetical protein